MLLIHMKGRDFSHVPYWYNTIECGNDTHMFAKKVILCKISDHFLISHLLLFLILSYFIMTGCCANCRLGLGCLAYLLQFSFLWADIMSH